MLRRGTRLNLWRIRGRFSYARNELAQFAPVIFCRYFVPKAFPAGSARPPGRGNHAAADHLRGRHRLSQLPAGPQGRDRARAANRAQHPPDAGRRDAAHDRRAAGAGADGHAARTATSTVSAASRSGFLEQYSKDGVVLVADRDGRMLFSSLTADTASLPPRNNRDIVEQGVRDAGGRNIPTCSSAR